MGVPLKSLPQNVRDWIFSEVLLEKSLQIFDDIPERACNIIQPVIDQVYQHNATVPELIALTQQTVPGERGRFLAMDIAGWFLLPVAEWLEEDVAARIKELGGEPWDYQDVVSSEDAIDTALKSVEVEVIPQRTRANVFARMESFLKGKLERADLLDSMMKPETVGGWGWDIAVATPVVESLEKSRQAALEKGQSFVARADIEAKNKRDAQRVALMKQEPTRTAALPDPFDLLAEENIAETVPEPTTPPPARDPFAELLFENDLTITENGLSETFEASIKKSDMLLEEEVKEIARRKEEIIQSIPETAIVTATTMEALLDRIAEDAGFATPDRQLKKRVRSILSARLRDIRDSVETARLLTRIAEGKKQELDREMVEKLLMETEKAFLDFQEKVIERNLQRERERRQNLQDALLKEKENEVKQEEAELNARYKRLTGRSQPVTLPQVPVQARITGALAETGTLLEPAAAKAPVATQEVPARRLVRVELSPQSMQAAPAAKPVVNDIAYERRLTGPVEELRMMRLADFRRLAKDPQAAAKKVLAKVELLAGEGQEKRLQGILAWRQSPLMSLYLAVTKEALDTEVPLATILQTRKKNTPDMLTPEEAQAIREINGQLRY